MTNKQPMLRFDHREVAVIFSLFIFVSLLMFSVGILVGKGLTQAKYEGMGRDITTKTATTQGEDRSMSGALGTSITTGQEETTAETEKSEKKETPGVESAAE